MHPTVLSYNVLCIIGRAKLYLVVFVVAIPTSTNYMYPGMKLTFWGNIDSLHNFYCHHS